MPRGRREIMAEENTVAELTGEQIESLELQVRKVSKIPGCVIVSMKGYIDTYNALQFQRQVENAINAGYNRLIFDFSGITYISSTGIGAFTYFLKEVKPRGGDMVFVGLIRRVIEVFELLGFSHFFHIVETLDEAVGMLDVQSNSAGGGLFPKVFACPICRKRLKAPKDGRFRCSECKTILVIDKTAQVSLG
jgi:anti-sigma B factor antagonist